MPSEKLASVVTARLFERYPDIVLEDGCLNFELKEADVSWGPGNPDPEEQYLEALENGSFDDDLEDEEYEEEWDEDEDIEEDWDDDEGWMDDEEEDDE